MEETPSDDESEDAATLIGGARGSGAGPGAVRVEGYDVRGAVGAGGMGVVHEAEDARFGRRIAIKVLRPEAAEDPFAMGKFVQEARITGRLEHPGIVPVHDLGLADDGRHYFAMKLVRGRSLGEILAATRADPVRSRDPLHRERLLSDFVRVCETVAFAHSRGVIHRDLKPDNVMIGEFGEVLVMDWGLARVEGGAAGVEETAAGLVLGTPAYMAPEQADGSVEGVDERTDVYALGGILYEILALVRPREGRDRRDLLARAAAGEVVPPARRGVGLPVPRELEAVVLKAMARDPIDRYPGALALKDDVEAWLAGRTVGAFRYGLAHRAAKWIGRHRATSAVAAGALVVVAAVSGVAAWRLAVENAETVRARDLAEARAAEVSRLLAERIRRDEALALCEEARLGLDQVEDYLYDPASRADVVFARLEEVRPILERAAARAPELALAPHLQGRAWAFGGDLDRAEASQRLALEIDPELGPALFELGRILTERAVLAYLRSASLRGTGDAVREAGQRLAREAADFLGRARARGATRVNPFVEAAARALLVLLGAERGEGTIELGLYSRLGARGSEDLHVLIGLHAAGEARRQAFDQAIAIRPRHPLALFLRGTTRQQAGDAAGALADYDEALRFRPRFVECLFQRAGLRLATGDAANALADLDQAALLAPGAWEVRLLRGDALARGGDREGARAEYDEAIRLAPRFAEAWANRGLLDAETDPSRAAADFRRALEVATPDWPHRGAVEAWLREIR